MLPVYLFYSMFGFQRVGDLAWALGDMRGRGILAGCTAGRTTLQGEGLQHDDGHSPLLASTNPAARIYDPAFAYEVAIVVEEAVAKILGPDPEDRFFYITLYNENYPMPALPEGEPGRRHQGRESCAACTGSQDATRPWPGRPRSASRDRCGRRPTRRVGFSASSGGSGATPGRSRRGPRFEATPSASSVGTGFTPGKTRAGRWSPTELGYGSTPVVAVTDYMRAIPDQVARWVHRPYVSLGTDGFGRSDARPALRHHFEVDAGHVVVAVLSSLAQTGEATPDEVSDAIKRFGIDPEAAEPFAP